MILWHPSLFTCRIRYLLLNKVIEASLDVEVVDRKKPRSETSTDPHGPQHRPPHPLWPQFLLSDPVTWISPHHPKPASVYLYPPTELQRTPPTLLCPSTNTLPAKEPQSQILFPALAHTDTTARATVVFELKNGTFCRFCNQSNCSHPSVCCFVKCTGGKSPKINIILFLHHKINIINPHSISSFR